MSMLEDIGELKVEKDRLLLHINQFAKQVVELERRLLLLQQAPQRLPTVVNRMRTYMAVGQPVRAADLSEALGIPLNTVHVTLRRHRKLFKRVGWGLYTRTS